MDEVKFVLSKYGFEIWDVRDLKARIATHTGEVQPGNYQWVSWQVANYSSQDNTTSHTWFLSSPFEFDEEKYSKLTDDEKNVFYI